MRLKFYVVTEPTYLTHVHRFITQICWELLVMAVGADLSVSLSLRFRSVRITNLHSTFRTQAESPSNCGQRFPSQSFMNAGCEAKTAASIWRSYRTSSIDKEILSSHWLFGLVA